MKTNYLDQYGDSYTITQAAKRVLAQTLDLSGGSDDIEGSVKFIFPNASEHQIEEITQEGRKQLGRIVDMLNQGRL